MASPEPEQNKQEQITFRFCRECSNMLYPKEDRVRNQLMFACRTCNFSEPATSSCVYRNHLYDTVGETAGVTQDVGSDPTVGHSHPVFPFHQVQHSPFHHFCHDEFGEEISLCEYCGRDTDEEHNFALDEDDGLDVVLNKAVDISDCLYGFDVLGIQDIVEANLEEDRALKRRARQNSRAMEDTRMRFGRLSF